MCSIARGGGNEIPGTADKGTAFGVAAAVSAEGDADGQSPDQRPGEMQAKR